MPPWFVVPFTPVVLARTAYAERATAKAQLQQGKTALVATHDLGRLETDFDGALYLNEGREVPAPPGAFVGLQVGQEAVWAG